LLIIEKKDWREHTGHMTEHMTEKNTIESTWRRLFSFKNGTSQKPNSRYVLIVDDEKPFLLSLSDGLSVYHDDFSVVTALNGKEAVKILETYHVDLVVTDLRMPKMDGFELLAYMTQNFPSIPVIVMTAFGTPEIESKMQTLGTFQYLEKPMDITVLANSIFTGLAAIPANNSKQSINLSTFLHLIEMEHTTGTLRVKSDEKIGYLFFNKGQLLAAHTDNAEGREAALNILSWNDAELDIKFKCEIDHINIDGTLTEILSELKTKEEAEKEEVEKAAEENKLRAEEEMQEKAEEEARKKAAEEAQRRAEVEAKKAAEETKRRAEIEAKKKAEEEAQKKAEEEENRRAKEEAKKAAEEEVRRKAAEEAQRRAEEEAKKKAEEEARKKAAEEAQRRAEVEAKKAAEEEARRKAAEDAKRKAEEEAKKVEEEESRKKAAEEAKRKAGEQTKQKIMAWKKKK
jgi:CheY-like chemotaxis protein